jgi:hypothetical protein
VLETRIQPYAPEVGQVDLGHADERPAHLLPQLVLAPLALLPGRDDLGRLACRSIRQLLPEVDELGQLGLEQRDRTLVIGERDRRRRGELGEVEVGRRRRLRTFSERREVLRDGRAKRRGLGVNSSARKPSSSVASRQLPERTSYAA